MLIEEPISRLITIKPTLENCCSIKQHLESTPIDGFNLQEIIPILYGGGRKWKLNSIFDANFGYVSNPLKYIVLAHQNEIEVDLFVLNSTLIIWLNDYSKGIELDYALIDSILVKKDFNNDKLYLILKVKNNGIFYNNDDTDLRPELIEFKIIPMFGEFERYYNDEIENLFTYENFGNNKGDKMVINTFNSILSCSAIKFNEIDNETGYNLNDNYYNNEGNADDIDFNEMNYDLEAGINVNIMNNEMKRGVIRSRDDQYSESNSKRICLQ